MPLICTILPVIGLILASAVGLAVTHAAWFHAQVSLGWALVPLGAGLIVGGRAARVLGLGLYLFWPVVLCSIGLIGLGFSPLWVSAGALVGFTLLSGLTTPRNSDKPGSGAIQTPGA